MKTILITGASGFIGSFLVEMALEKGWQTWAGIRKSSSREYLRDERIRFIDLDYADKEQLKAQIAQHGPWDYVVHNAGVTKCVHPDDFDRINYRYSKHLIEALQESDRTPGKFVLMSSLSAHHPGVSTRYGDSKLKAEDFLKAQTGFPYIIFCPTGVYGPRDKDYYLMLKMIQSGWDITAGFEPQKLTFVYVRDLAKAVFLSLEKPVCRKTYFLSDGQTYSDSEYTRIAKEALGKKRVVRLRIPLWALRAVSVCSGNIARWRHQASTLNRDKYEIMKQRDWTCDTLPVARDLDFSADYALKRGLTESVEWYRANGWL
ncbi:MAG: NAD(P)-dependent oxidoreductase [Dysgonamonadaceae bacterium]|jgi:nucleoside-diphosphate-sugar epimerase|nr:NAD(P)-dependent oxidoreductase [Dysgonamonadaceae bacterium]